MALAFVAGWLAVAGHMSVLLRLSAFVYVRARGPIEFQLRPKSETSELRPIHDRTPGISVRPCQQRVAACAGGSGWPGDWPSGCVRWWLATAGRPGGESECSARGRPF